MKYRLFGKTGLLVSAMGFGCWALGGQSYGAVRDEESLEALETAFDHGVNFYDTADSYGDGRSERVLAEFLKGKPRDKVILATKVGFDFYHGGIKKNFDAAYVRYCCEESLKRLGVDAIDLYQLHNPTLEVLRRGEAVGVLEKLRREGKIRHIGVSVWGEEEALTAVRDLRVETLQVIFNLLDQRMSDRVFSEAQKRQVGVVAREPLGRGLLTGKYRLEHLFPENDHRKGWSREMMEWNLKKIEKIKTILATKRFTLVRAALEYVLDFETVSTTIPGAKTKAQVLENLLAVEDPRLRSEESANLRDLYLRVPIFKKGFD